MASDQRAVDHIQTVTGETFRSSVLKRRGPTVVEFMSYGCAHCRALEPALQQVAQALESTEKLFRVNIAVEPQLSDDFGIQGTPTLLMFLSGQEIGRVEGPHPSVSNVLTAVTEPFEREQRFLPWEH